MEVLFYTDTPHLGGAEKQMQLLAKHLTRLGVQVSLAYGGYSQIEESHFKPYCKAIYSLSTLHKHDPRHYYRLKEILKQGKFDLVHIHLWNPGACRYAFWAAQEAHTPVITTEHDPFPLRGLKRWIKQSCLKKTRQTIVISRENHRLMKESYGLKDDQVTLVHNGIEMQAFAAIPNPFRRDQACLIPTEGVGNPWESLGVPGIAPSATVVTCIAELHPRKGHQYLLRAFEELGLATPNLHLCLVGKGPLEIPLREKYGDHPNLHFLGWRNDIPDLLRASDIVILPSLKEAFGLVILEAMASGTAVIGTNAGGIPDIIQDGTTGLLIPPANPEKIITAIYTLLKNPDRKKDIEKAALKRVEQEFTTEKMARETWGVYQKVTSFE